MTAAEVLRKEPGLENYIERLEGQIGRFAVYAAMKEYARIKCAEQREMCFKNAEYGHDLDFNPYDRGYSIWIERESILNAPEPPMI